MAFDKDLRSLMQSLKNEGRPLAARLLSDDQRRETRTPTAPEYRAHAAALRTIATLTLSPGSEARILAVAAAWDARFEERDLAEDVASP